MILHALFVSNSIKVVGVTDLSDFELALAALRHKITTKQGKVYQDIRVIIINSIEKLVSSCECFEKKGFEILNGFLRRYVLSVKSLCRPNDNILD